jgi:hypothetical protein
MGPVGDGTGASPAPQDASARVEASRARRSITALLPPLHGEGGREATGWGGLAKQAKKKAEFALSVGAISSAPLIPAEAGTQCFGFKALRSMKRLVVLRSYWVPASAGMSGD